MAAGSRNRSAAASARRSPTQSHGGRCGAKPPPARRTSSSCCSTMSASPISAATARRSGRRPSTGSRPKACAIRGFHTTAMCSTTRAALLTGRNHHSVGVGCLANFDSPAIRLSRQDRARGGDARRDAAAARLSQLHGRQVARHAVDRERRHRTVRRLAARRALTASTVSSMPRPINIAPELVSDKTPVSIRPGLTNGYHLTPIWSTQSIRFIADHAADRPDLPWLTWLALGACHAPHQAPPTSSGAMTRFAHGWDVEREQRMARQKAMGLVPQRPGCRRAMTA